MLVALTEESLAALRDEVAEDGALMFDGPAGQGVLGLEFTKAAKAAAGSAVMANTVAAGAVFALLARLARAGYGVCVVTHDLNLAGAHCHEILLLSAEHEVAAAGPPGCSGPETEPDELPCSLPFFPNSMVLPPALNPSIEVLVSIHYELRLSLIHI